MLARQRIFIETDDSQLNDIINNTKLSEYYLALGQVFSMIHNTFLFLLLGPRYYGS